MNKNKIAIVFEPLQNDLFWLSSPLHWLTGVSCKVSQCHVLKVNYDERMLNINVYSADSAIRWILLPNWHWQKPME